MYASSKLSQFILNVLGPWWFWIFLKVRLTKCKKSVLDWWLKASLCWQRQGQLMQSDISLNQNVYFHKISRTRDGKSAVTMWIAGVRVAKAKASGIWPTRLDLSCVQSQLTTAFQINAPILFYLCQSLLSDEGAVAKPGRAGREGGQILRWIFNRLQ